MMSRHTIVVACLLFAGGCLITPVMKFGEGKTAKQAQHDTMASFGPARLASGETWKGEVPTRKVRVWADNQYRTQNIHWEKTFNDALELANVVLTPVYGIHLVAEFHVWERDIPGATLTDSITALQERDPGTDVFAVIGLTSSLPLVSATFDQLGLGALGGRHIMLRGYADIEERKAYANAFPDLTPEERELALDHLRHHKTAVVLLHELGHNLGVDHEADTTTIMNASYSNHATTFSPTARSIMLHTVDERLHRATSDVASTPPSPIPAATPAAAAQPPAAAPAPTPSPSPVMHHDPITIRVTRKKQTLVNGKVLTAEALDTLLKSAHDEDAHTQIIISQDRNLPTGVISNLVDRLKAAGFAKAEFAWSGR